MIARNYRTSKGTELPLLNLKGKQYLEVKYRLVWFREDHPDWSIETELMSVTDVSAYARATIRDEKGRVIATSHKYESIQGFPDFIEKAETGAIGRALALIGYGTQFCADELDEGKRIVDSPVPTRHRPELVRPNRDESQPAEPARAGAEARGDASEDLNNEDSSAEADEPVTGFDPGDYMINFGRKYKGKKLKEISKNEMEGYIKWLESSAQRDGTQLSHQARYLKSAFDRLYSESDESATESPSHH